MTKNKVKIAELVNIVITYRTQSSPLVKPLLKTLSNSSGRNNLGRITSFHKGGGHKKRYRRIDFSSTDDKVAVVTSIEYDPNRNCPILSVCNIESKKYSYKLAPKGSRIGDIIKTGAYAELRLGHSMPLRKVPLGSCLHCLSSTVYSHGTIARSAGTYVKLKTKTPLIAEISASSGQILFIPVTCNATLGVVSVDHSSLTKNRKAGRSRWLNKRPTVRGVAMNPVDHPHGGGEGKTSGGRTSVTPWGKPHKSSKPAKRSHTITTAKRPIIEANKTEK